MQKFPNFVKRLTHRRRATSIAPGYFSLFVSEKRPELAQARDRLFENLLGFDPIIRIVLRDPLLAHGRQDRRHPVADQDKQNVVRVALGNLDLGESLNRAGARHEKGDARAADAQTGGGVGPPFRQIIPFCRADHGR